MLDVVELTSAGLVSDLEDFLVVLRIEQTETAQRARADHHVALMELPFRAEVHPDLQCS